VLGVTAVPLSETVCGLPAALSVNVTVPFTLPVVSGARLTLTAQFAPGARVVPQLLVSVKFALAAMLVILSAAVPELVSVISRGSLVWPSTSSPKVRLLAEKETLGDVDKEALDDPPQPMSTQEPRRSISRRKFRKMPSSPYGLELGLGLKR
jgi:hypothetical protein